MENKVQYAVELFKEGYNCSQAVTTAFADMYGLTKDQALRISASFGGGIGRMREACGAACGLFILAGLATGSTDPKDKEGKVKNYALVQQLAKSFKERNGALICRELLELRKNTPVSAVPEDRTEQYYAKRPCLKIIEEAAKIWSEYLQK